MLRPVRILYMDDDEGVAVLFKRKLERLGYNVDLAGNGEEGLSLYDRNRYDLVAVDQRMPIHDGIEVLRMMTTRGELPPTIMITGAGDEKVAVEAMKLGAGDYIVKDVEGGYLELLPSVIEQLLRQRQLEQERRAAVEALEKRNKNLTILNDVNQALTETVDVEEVLQRSLNAAATLINADCASLWLVTDSYIQCRATWCAGEYKSLIGVQFPVEETLAGEAISNDESLTVTYSEGDPRHADASVYPIPVRSIFAVTLRNRDRIIGALEVANGRSEFNREDYVMIEALSSSTAIAINNAALVASLQEHTADLQMRNEELDAFAHMVAHDLKNPLSPIIGYVQFIKKYYASHMDSSAMEYLSEIEQNGFKMQNIIDELLLLSMLRKTEVELQPLDMDSIVKSAVIRLTHMVEEHHGKVSWQKGMPRALGHQSWVEQVWINYVSNALKYGGRPPLVEIGASTNEETCMVEYWVRDNGLGLTDEQCSRLFTPFTRLDQVRVEGHGLGLSIVRRIVEKLGGEVSVRSSLGEGSVFSFTLPLAR
jgi:signal transduction histidine kinase/DNA-binding response OmpR family regulator